MSEVNFTYDIGYMGVVKLGDWSSGTSAYNANSSTYSMVGDPTAILATGGNINIEQSPIFSTGVWGAGWYNAAQQIAYAPNYVTTSGSVNYELTLGKAFTHLQDFAFEKRNLGKMIYILPNGVAGYYGRGWCEGCSFSASQDSIVTGDFNFKTGNVQNCINTSSITDQDKAKNGTANVNEDFTSNYLAVFPFWASGVCLDMSGDTIRPEQNQAVNWDENAGTARNDIIDWNASYSSQLVLVATCANYGSVEQSKQAKYCALGTMTADGSFTIFKVAADLDPDKIRECRKCTIEMGPACQPDEKAKIIFGSIVFSSGSTDVQTGSSFIQSSFNFTALGNGKNPIMSLKQGTWQNYSQSSNQISNSYP